MAEPALEHFDFDDWAALALSDPEAFELRRAEAIDRVIQQAQPERQQRLRRLQWRIDRVRERSGTPLAACIRLNDMMWESVMGERGLLESLNRLTDPATPTEAPAPAKVLDFPGRRRDS